jgi:uncharacterized membrane protein
MTAFLRRTLVGGLLVVVVFSTIGYLLWLAVSWSQTGLAQVAAVLSIDTGFPALSALIALLLLVVFLGLLLQTPPVHRMVAAAMAWLGDRFPFSRLLHGFELELMGLGKSPVKVALVVVFNTEVLAFVMEELADGRCIVFVPGSPNPSIGAVYVVPPDCVRLIDAMHYQVASCVSNWGAGASKLLERAHASA